MKFIKKPQKSLGQNFLFDKNIINKIVNITKIGQNNSILEIGSGTGFLSLELARNGLSVVGVDLSETLINITNHINLQQEDLLTLYH